MFFKSNKQAFTLVELIVVITILAVLGTIAFLSFQSYTVYARDTVRLSNLKNIESGLQIQYTKGGYYAVPDDSVNITASGTLIRQQGVFGPNSLRTIQANTDASKDPLTEQYYDYVTDAYQSEYQLIGYMEGNEVANVGTAGLLSLQNIHAATQTGYTMKTLGQDLGVVSIGGNNLHRNPANIGQDFDIRNNSNQEYTIKFDQTDEITSASGALLFSNVYNRSTNLLNNKELAKHDPSLVLYFDMETTTMSGSLKVLRDLSYYGNKGLCYNSGSLLGCGEGKGGPYFTKGYGKNFGGSIAFNDDDYVLVPKNSDFYSTGSLTLSVYIKIEDTDDGNVGLLLRQGQGIDMQYGLYVNKSTYYSSNISGIRSWYHSYDTDFSWFSNFGGESSYQKGYFINITMTRDEDGVIRIYGDGNKVYDSLLIPGKAKTLSGSTYDINNSFPPNEGGDLTIGSHIWQAVRDYQKFNGEIDEVRIYNRLFTEKEIKGIVRSTLR